jgi:3-isopropylmalate/(R)-2-methylmalate dehydratase small subunit
MAVAAKGGKLTVDLEHQTVSAYPENLGFTFNVDPFRKHCLLNGLDDIGLTEQKSDDIATYEARQKQEQVWL